MGRLADDLDVLNRKLREVAGGLRAVTSATGELLESTVTTTTPGAPPSAPGGPTGSAEYTGLGPARGTGAAPNNGIKTISKGGGTESGISKGLPASDEEWYEAALRWHLGLKSFAKVNIYAFPRSFLDEILAKYREWLASQGEGRAGSSSSGGASTGGGRGRARPPGSNNWVGGRPVSQNQVGGLGDLQFGGQGSVSAGDRLVAGAVAGIGAKLDKLNQNIQGATSLAVRTGGG